VGFTPRTLTRMSHTAENHCVRPISAPLASVALNYSVPSDLPSILDPGRSCEDLTHTTHTHTHTHTHTREFCNLTFDIYVEVFVWEALLWLRRK
jgi:hypothetical protein